MKIVEQFSTLQGEGKYLGIPSHFIRTTGCNLRCEWKNTSDGTTRCDTPYTSFSPEKGYDLDVMDTLDKLRTEHLEHIVITGGEPTLQDDLVRVTNQFLDHHYQVTLETNATNYRLMMEGSFISMSPKLSSSYNQVIPAHEKIHAQNNNFRDPAKRWMRYNDYQFKFVINHPFDLAEVDFIKHDLHIPRNKIWLMPQGITTKQLNEKSQWLFEECVNKGYNYSPRMHIDIFGNKRGI